MVPAERIAAVLQTTEDNVIDIAMSMGLPRDMRVPSETNSRGYITIIRRNWHLLPYQQLVDLLDMKEEDLALKLREDDFLYIKLGSLKPKCANVVYSKPSHEARRGAREIKNAIEQEFGKSWNHVEEPRFSFVSNLTRPSKAASLEADPSSAKNKERPKFIYSYFALFGDPLSDPALDPFPDGLLSRLHDLGVNGVWLHVILRQLAPGGPHFPEWGEGHQQRLTSLRRFVTRASKHNIRIYLYINEPRAMPKAFFVNRPEMAGVEEGQYSSVCTSDPRTRRWLSDSLAHVFREVPGLGGIFAITASENLTNCASHGNHETCLHCKNRSYSEIISQVMAAMEEGVHRAAPDATVIAWDWGWKEQDNTAGIIAKLPKQTWLMSVSEWSLPIERGGVRSTVNEYSLSAVGPGPRATRNWQLAKQRGLKTIAKVQLNNSWELSTVPYLPVMDLVAQHCLRLVDADVDGFMLSWSLGGYPSMNIELINEFSKHQTADIHSALQNIAQRNFGSRAASSVRQAWTKFSRSFQDFPYGDGTLYLGPQHMGPANLLFATNTGYAATMVGFPYDDLKGWSGQYPFDVLGTQFSKVADGWAEGLQDLKIAQGLVPEPMQPEAAADLRVAQAAQIHFASSANQVKFILARDKFISAKNLAKKEELRRLLISLLDDEIQLASQLYRLAIVDSRLGYEASNHYFYVPLDLVEKVINCAHLREHYKSSK